MANDAPDPITYLLEGLDGENFVEVASGSVADFPTRFHTNYIFFDNGVAYSGYRLLFPTVDASRCMQIAEVEFLGVQLPGDATSQGTPLSPPPETALVQKALVTRLIMPTPNI